MTPRPVYQGSVGRPQPLSSSCYYTLQRTDTRRGKLLARSSDRVLATNVRTPKVGVRSHSYYMAGHVNLPQHRVLLPEMTPGPDEGTTPEGFFFSTVTR